jgi:tRNA uridine 5-carboxymethylaminomethyl modification enzyme
VQQVETDIKFSGYIEAQEEEVVRLGKMESIRIPEGFMYNEVHSLSREVREKLAKIRPANLGHAARIEGVTPAAISMLMVHLSARS